MRPTETRYTFGNPHLVLDFDPRTADTMYNYVWIRHPGTRQLVRVYNFGCDVDARMRDTGELGNAVGVKLQLQETAERTGRTLAVRYPSPLVRYGQFADATDREKILNYPDLPPDFDRRLRVADGSVTVFYQIDDDTPGFRTWARLLGGVVPCVKPILDGLWTDFYALPRQLYVDGLGSFAGRRDPPIRQMQVRDVRYLLFYSDDGAGVPVAVVIEGRQRQVVWPFYAVQAWARRCHFCSTNQAFVPDPATIPVEGFNDINLPTPFGPAGETTAVHWLFFPDLGWGRSGGGEALLRALRERVESRHLAWWDGPTREPSIEFWLRLWPEDGRPAASRRD